MHSKINRSHNLPTLFRRKKTIIESFKPANSDVLGSYTGSSAFNDEPEQDADDL